MTDKSSDKVFDYFVEEMLTQQNPPDLSARIESAWAREKAGLTAAGESSTRKTFAAPGVKAIPIRAPQPSRTAFTTRSGASRRRNAIAVLLAVGACGLLAVLATQLPQQVVPLQAVNSPPSSPGLPQVAATAHELVPNRERRFTPEPPEVLNIDDLPFALDRKTAAQDTGNAVPIPAQVQPMTAQKISASIDERLAAVWQAMQVTPTQTLAPLQLAQRLSVLLTNRSLTDIEARQLADSGADSGIDELIQKALGSHSFSQVWSEHFTELWLARGSIERDDPQLQSLKQQVANFIESQQPWNEIPNLLLGRELAEPEDAASTTFLSAMAGNGNHRLAARIGSSFLDANLACVRCHDALDGGSQPAALNSEPRIALRSQQSYWSLIALLQGIDATGNSSREPRKLIDRQPESLATGKTQTAFFDRLDGVLQAANPHLLDGQNWDTIPGAPSPRIALATWIGQSQLLDEATVNQVWKFVFGRPLMPQLLASDSDPKLAAALTARRELQQLLAQQFRAHGYNLQELVGWIVRSHAVARQPLDLSRSQWLGMPEADLARLQKTELSFASGPSQNRMLRSESPATLEGSLAGLLQWKNETSLGSSNSSTTLAQPAPVSPNNNPRSKAAGPRTTKQPLPDSTISDYALHGELHTSDEIEFIDRLLKSQRLSWEECVEHVVGLNSSSTANGRVKQLAGDLLQQHNGNTRAALLDLLWAVRNSDV